MGRLWKPRKCSLLWLHACKLTHDRRGSHHFAYCQMMKWPTCILSHMRANPYPHTAVVACQCVQDNQSRALLARHSIMGQTSETCLGKGEGRGGTWPRVVIATAFLLLLASLSASMMRGRISGTWGRSPSPDTLANSPKVSKTRAITPLSPPPAHNDRESSGTSFPVACGITHASENTNSWISDRCIQHCNVRMRYFVVHILGRPSRSLDQISTKYPVTGCSTPAQGARLHL